MAQACCFGPTTSNTKARQNDMGLSHEFGLRKRSFCILRIYYYLIQFFILDPCLNLPECMDEVDQTSPVDKGYLFEFHLQLFSAPIFPMTSSFALTSTDNASSFKILPQSNISEKLWVLVERVCKNSAKCAVLACYCAYR